MKKIVIGVLIAIVIGSVGAYFISKKAVTKSDTNKKVTVNADDSKENKDVKSDKIDEDKQKNEDKVESDTKEEKNTKEDTQSSSVEQKTQSNSNTVEDELTKYIINNVPEVKSLKDSLEKNKSKINIYVERNPDGKSQNKYYKDYYGIYVGQITSNQSSNMYRFAINKDTKDTVFYDVIEDSFMSLDEWRKSPNYKR